MKTRRNTKRVKISIPSQSALKMVKSSTFKYLSRLDLQIGDNYETVNHQQFSNMNRMYPLIGIEVTEI